MPKKFKSSAYSVYVGNDSSSFDKCVNAYDSMRKDGFDFTLVNLRSRFIGRFDDFVDIRKVNSSIFNSSFVGVVCLGAETFISPTSIIEEARTQLRWAVHAGMYAAVLRLSQFELLSLSKIISEFCSENAADQSITRLWVECSVDDWSEWDQLRTMCSHPSNVNVSLVYESAMFSTDSFLMSRWLAEPVSVLRFLPCESLVYSLNLFRFVQRNSQLIVPSVDVKNALLSMIASAPDLKWNESYVGPYHDTLQIPLQPLADNMDNVVYETFEADRTKYDLYEEAIYRALKDLTMDYPEESLFIIAVVGAGRGGLIDSSLRAIARLSSTVRFEIRGIEKNPNAARTLHFRVSDEPSWQNVVSIVEADMRQLPVTDCVDVLVSELLGSLGDNEASPECISGVIRWLNPLRGICIPHNYYSTIEPVSCSKIWSATRDAKKLETPLVVQFHTSFHPSAPLTLFAFESRSDLSMTASLSWTVEEGDYLLHGFAGYFHADLYGGVTMSTHPPTRTEGMVSWFPAFLPLRAPVLVHAGQQTTLHVYRESNLCKMFIQWTLVEPTTLGTHNVNGSAHWVGL